MKESEKQKRTIATPGRQFGKSLEHEDVVSIRPLGGVFQQLAEFINNQEDACRFFSSLDSHRLEKTLEGAHIAGRLHMSSLFYESRYFLGRPAVLRLTLTNRFADSTSQRLHKPLSGTGEQHRPHPSTPSRPIDRFGDS
jgi:hypothetical protein